jgi:hypothetical protein
MCFEVLRFEVVSLVYRWFPPCRWGEAEGFAWPERGHGFIDAIRLAELVPETQSPKLETQNPKAESRNLKP